MPLRAAASGSGGVRAGWPPAARRGAGLTVDRLADLLDAVDRSSDADVIEFSVAALHRRAHRGDLALDLAFGLGRDLLAVLRAASSRRL